MGWCFWHRSCYGCLLCGDKRVVQGVSVEELFGDNASRGPPGRSAEPGRSKGREIDEIPLCVSCVEEISRETADDDHLIPMALHRIDRFDGGLSRRRWEARMGQTTHDNCSHDTPSSSGIQSELENQTNTSDNSAQSRGKHVPRTPSPIYVSMHDPVGGPAFQRSKTKPIPRWMQYLPGRRSDEKDSMERPSSVLDDYFSPHESSVAESDMESGMAASSPSPPPVPPHRVPVSPATPRSNEEQPTGPVNPADSEPSIISQRPSPAFVPEPVERTPAFKGVQMSRPFTFIDEKPGQRPSSRFQPGHPEPNRHVRFISPPKTTSSPTMSSGSVGHARPPSESSEYLDRHVHPAGQVKSSVLLPSSLLGGNLSVATPIVKRSTGVNAGPPAKIVLRSFAERSCSPDVARGSTEAEGMALGKFHPKHPEHAAQDRIHGGGDGAAEPVGEKRLGRAVTLQDQLKKVFGFS